MSAISLHSWIKRAAVWRVIDSLPKVWRRGTEHSRACYWRWGKNGRLVANSVGRIVQLPQLGQHALNQLGDVLLAFPNGFCLDVEGKVVPRLDISSVGDDLARRDEDAGGKLTGFCDLVNHLPKQAGNEVERVLHDGDRPGVVHDLPFVIVVLPRSEAYSRFPEIAPSSAKDCQQ